MKAVVAAFNQEKALVGAFSVITNLRMQLFEALVVTHDGEQHPLQQRAQAGRGRGAEAGGEQARGEGAVLHSRHTPPPPGVRVNLYRLREQEEGGRHLEE